MWDWIRKKLGIEDINTAFHSLGDEVRDLRARIQVLEAQNERLRNDGKMRRGH